MRLVVAVGVTVPVVVGLCVLVLQALKATRVPTRATAPTMILVTARNTTLAITSVL